MSIKLKEIYIVGEGWYEGEKIFIDGISSSKNIIIGKTKFTQVHGVLLKYNKKINTILEFLIVDYSKLSKFELIKKIIEKDLKAKKEYIIRYKTLPKIK